MAKAKGRWVVRITTFADADGYTIGLDHIPLSFLESLRYAGLIRMGPETRDAERLTRHFDMIPPRDINSQSWADANAERMRTFGYRAESLFLANS